jgi:hypothetical protein
LTLLRFSLGVLWDNFAYRDKKLSVSLCVFMRRIKVRCCSVTAHESALCAIRTGSRLLLDSVPACDVSLLDTVVRLPSAPTMYVACMLLERTLVDTTHLMDVRGSCTCPCTCGYCSEAGAWLPTLAP